MNGGSVGVDCIAHLAENILKKNIFEALQIKTAVHVSAVNSLNCKAIKHTWLSKQLCTNSEHEKKDCSHGEKSVSNTFLIAHTPKCINRALTEGEEESTTQRR